MSVDANKEIRRAVDTGEVAWTKKHKRITLGGKMLIVSNNIPSNEKESQNT